jgi:hypothetical protein
VSVCPLAQSARGRIEVRPFGSPGRTDQLADFAKVAEFQRRNVDCPFCASPPAMLVDADLEPPGRPARVRDGVLVTLPDQDRSAWISDQIEEGHALVRQCLALNRPGPYQIQAAINAVHTDRRWPWPLSTTWTWARTTRSTPPALTCYAGSAGTTKPVRPRPGDRADRERGRAGLARRPSGFVRVAPGRKKQGYEPVSAPGPSTGAIPRRAGQASYQHRNSTDQ